MKKLLSIVTLFSLLSISATYGGRRSCRSGACSRPNYRQRVVQTANRQCTNGSCSRTKTNNNHDKNCKCTKCRAKKRGCSNGSCSIQRRPVRSACRGGSCRSGRCSR